MNRLLTTSEAAEMLRVSSRTVLNWIERDAIPYIALPTAGSKREYRIPLLGLLNSLSGNYDLSTQLDALGAAGIGEEQLQQAEQQVRAGTASKRVPQPAG